MVHKRLKILIWAIIVSLFAFYSLSIYARAAHAASSSSFELTITKPLSAVIVTPTVKPTVLDTSASTQSTSQENLLLLILLSLGSGVIGAIIGGLFTYFGSVKAAREQIKALFKQEKDNRNYVEDRQTNTMKQALLLEAQENLTIVQTWGGGEFSYYLSTEAWSIYKGSLNKLPEALQNVVLQAYIEIKRYNSLVEFDKFNKLRATRFVFNEQSEKVKTSCLSIIRIFNQDPDELLTAG